MMKLYFQNLFWGERYNLREDIGGFPIKIGDISDLNMKFNYEQLFGTETYKVALNHFLNIAFLNKSLP